MFFDVETEPIIKVDSDPSKGTFSVEIFISHKRSVLMITDDFGKLLYKTIQEKRKSLFRSILEVSDFSPGQYNLIVMLDNHVFSKKIKIHSCDN